MSTDVFSPLFSPVTISGLNLRNRIVMSPMSRYRSPGGVPDAAVVDYYRRRAAAGVGLIVSEATYIDHPGAPVYQNVPHFFGEAALAGWRRVLDAVHGLGAAMVPQIWHVGNNRKRGAPPDPALPGFGPSKIEQDGQTLVVEMTHDDMRDVADSYARSAYSARELGFDGVAIHGGHGYLLDQFFWPVDNRRDDGYGGTIENRCRLAVEVVGAMRRAVGDGFPILFRFSQWKATDYDARIAETPEELGLFLRLLTRAGVDIFDVSTRRFWQSAFDGDPKSLAAWTRHLSHRPVIAVGSIGLDQPHQSKFFRTADNVASSVTDLRMVEEGLARGDFDLAAVGRAILADPQWVEKARRGAFDEILPFTRAAMDDYH
ncbi:MAG TPA: NADH:flavin oxidoreductase [Aliidongia sp.]|uniref:NADH:flavin oxidoreductase n=1 Tax=Aliidongia sp. TaxID=1914230 RepID=UPI002DDD5CD0|nr:NADH:flavin oxidoreductase [Aliidongia sp.]HEV2673771.1 NADH:flavin oxidoreductase [Aliidongia sp.]